MPLSNSTSRSISLCAVAVPLAIAWDRLASLQGELRSQINLAGTLLTGDASPADITEAAALYAQAAELGEPCGIFQLGWLAATGKGQ